MNTNPSRGPKSGITGRQHTNMTTTTSGPSGVLNEHGQIVLKNATVIFYRVGGCYEIDIHTADEAIGFDVPINKITVKHFRSDNPERVSALINYPTEPCLHIGYGNLTTNRYSCGLCAQPVEWGGVEIELPETPKNPPHWTCGIVVCAKCAAERDPELAAIAEELEKFECTLLDSGLWSRGSWDDGYRYLSHHHLLMAAICEHTEDMRRSTDPAVPKV